MFCYRTDYATSLVNHQGILTVPLTKGPSCGHLDPQSSSHLEPTKEQVSDILPPIYWGEDVTSSREETWFIKPDHFEISVEPAPRPGIRLLSGYLIYPPRGRATTGNFASQDLPFKESVPGQNSLSRGPRPGSPTRTGVQRRKGTASTGRLRGEAPKPPPGCVGLPAGICSRLPRPVRTPTGLSGTG